MENILSKEDNELITKVLDKLNIYKKTNLAKHTNFLDPRQIQILKRVLKNEDFRAYGGYDGAERQIILFGEGSFPIDLLKITHFDKDNFLSHRDYLGALTSLGIEREILGDIIVKENEAYVFVMSHITDFIINNLIKVKNENVKVSKIEDFGVLPKLEFVKIQGTVQSLRLDSIVALFARSSRQNALELIMANKVFLNYIEAKKPSSLVKDGDIISVRGFGKGIINVGDYSRKGRIFVTINKYV